MCASLRRELDALKRSNQSDREAVNEAKSLQMKVAMLEASTQDFQKLKDEGRELKQGTHAVALLSNTHSPGLFEQSWSPRTH